MIVKTLYKEFSFLFYLFSRTTKLSLDFILKRIVWLSTFPVTDMGFYVGVNERPYRLPTHNVFFREVFFFEEGFLNLKIGGRIDTVVFVTTVR